MEQSFEDLVVRIGEVVRGKEQEIKLALACLFAKGHLLIEDIPGIGKTTLAKTLSHALGLEFQRIQCTSDMLPGDILGVSVFEQQSAQFRFHEGPVFTQVLLADEINRTTPKTQSALLEAMEEYQVTVEGETRILEAPFFVIATQNPLEQAGTYPLPESQLDRFLMRIRIGYPERSAEREILKSGGYAYSPNGKAPVFSSLQVIEIQTKIDQIFVSDSLYEYVQDLLEYTRESGHFVLGMSPRAGLSLLQAARAWAFLEGRDHAVPKDVQSLLPHVAGHRLRLRDTNREATPEKLKSIFQEVPIPK